MTLTDKQIAKIMKMRALGFHHDEIAQIIGCSRPSIGYHFKQIYKRAKNGESEELFWGMVASEAGMGTVELLRKLKMY